MGPLQTSTAGPDQTSTLTRRRASRPGEVWALDFQFDATNDGRQLKCLNIVDEFTRQALASEVARSCDADGVLRVLDRLQAEHGAPAFLRMDNGPEMIATALKRLCRQSACGHPLHRARKPLAERLRRVVSLKDARRALEPGGVLHADRSTHPHRAMANRVSR